MVDQAQMEALTGHPTVKACAEFASLVGLLIGCLYVMLKGGILAIKGAVARGRAKKAAKILAATPGAVPFSAFASELLDKIYNAPARIRTEPVVPGGKTVVDVLLLDGCSLDGIAWKVHGEEVGPLLTLEETAAVRVAISERKRLIREKDADDKRKRLALALQVGVGNHYDRSQWTAFADGSLPVPPDCVDSCGDPGDEMEDELKRVEAGCTCLRGHTCDQCSEFYEKMQNPDRARNRNHNSRKG